MNDLVYRSAVVFQLYRACLNGEITKEEFIRTKDIVRRAVPVESEVALKWKRYAEGNDKKYSRLAGNIYWALWCFLFIALAWAIMEICVYGERQPRIVDDIVTVMWLGFVYSGYRRGYRHGKEDW